MKKRREQILKRKNFLPTLIVTLLFWGFLGGIVYFIEPEAFGIISLFFALLFFALLFTSSLIFGSRRRGLIVSISLTLFMLLRYFGIGNILNFLLIAGLAITVELYLSRG